MFLYWGKKITLLKVPTYFYIFKIINWNLHWKFLGPNFKNTTKIINGSKTKSLSSSLVYVDLKYPLFWYTTCKVKSILWNHFCWYMTFVCGIYLVMKHIWLPYVYLHEKLPRILSIVCYMFRFMWFLSDDTFKKKKFSYMISSIWFLLYDFGYETYWFYYDVNHT